MTKKEIFAKLSTQKSWSTGDVIHLFSSLSLVKCPPKQLRNGDVFIHKGLNHPIVIIDAEQHIGVMLSGTEGVRTIMKANSRFLTDNFVTSTLVMIDDDMALMTFLCVYDNPLEIHRIKLKLQKYWKNLLKIK